MISEKSFNAMFELFEVDRVLVNAIISTFTFFEYTIFSGILKNGYNHYTTVDQQTREQFEMVFNAVVEAIS